MKTEEELLAMSREELAKLAYDNQNKALSYEYMVKQNARLREILSAVGIAYETYKREY